MTYAHKCHLNKIRVFCSRGAQFKLELKYDMTELINMNAVGSFV